MSPHSGPQNQGKGPKHQPQNTAKGRVQAVGLQTGCSRPARSGRGAQGGRFPCPLPGRTRPEPPSSQYWLPPFRGPPGLASVVRLAPELTFASRAAASPSVGQNSVHPQRLPAPAGSSPSAGQEVWPPPRTHPLTRLQARRGPPGAGFRTRGSWQPGLAAQGSAPGRRGPCLPPPTRSLPAFGTPWSAKPAGRGRLILAVTSLLPCSSGWGRFSCRPRSVLVTTEASEKEKVTAYTFVRVLGEGDREGNLQDLVLHCTPDRGRIETPV